MNKVFKFIFALIPAMLIGLYGINYNMKSFSAVNAEIRNEEKTESVYFIGDTDRTGCDYPISAGEAVLETTTERVLFAHNENARLPMASTTKIMTALIILEECDPEVIVTVPKETVGVEGSSIYLTEGEKISVQNLLYGLMLRSGNDCAETLAVFHSGSISRFVQRMNERAEEMGLKDTHFVNPHGLPASGHYTTAKELALLTCKAMQNNQFKKLVSTKSVVVPDGGCGYARKLVNKNKMLYNYQLADGVKTGYTKAAGRCLVSSATKDGMQIVCAVLNSPSMYERSAALMDKAFAEFSYEKIYDANKIYTLKTNVNTKFCRCKAKTDIYYPLRESEKKSIKLETELPKKLMLPVYTGDNIGNLKVYLENQLIFSQKIDSIDTVKKTFTDILHEISEKIIHKDI